MNQVDYRHYFKGRVWKNEGSQKVQEVGMYHDEEERGVFFGNNKKTL